MKTFRITRDNDRFQLQGRDFRIPTGEAVSLEQILEALNRQAGKFTKFYEAEGGGVGYSVLTRDMQIMKGRVEL